MSRPKRNFQPGFSYHITTRCNNREFRLTRLEVREVFLYAIKKVQQKHGFKLSLRAERSGAKQSQDFGIASLSLAMTQIILHTHL